MNKQQYLGEFEHAVLLTIIALKDNAYGVTIKSHLKDCVGRDVSIGALYSTTERLEKKGLLESRKSGATAARGGKAKRFFNVTASGLQAIKITKSQIEKLWASASLQNVVSL
ncbi:PadR family transcriptional regulator [Glaciecola sp. XM2]|jgi:DNA-binding PadR family transcriptional regulator|uniref:PadR family transcriptional regulator n=1 Tax=Glaciecola sp. XM2 TaxID=1914931 RepID=UPI001BDE2F45|nr:helix-turn-helix transcriptional regulator [Glaciecola sp. XM2]MBT1449324.1 PadR family transcriptional regulator [Glaciecola sp. XM2]